jgi:MFS family permease
LESSTPFDGRQPAGRQREGSLRYAGWSVVGASGVSVCLASLAVYTFPILLKPLTDEFGWSREGVSTAYAAMAIMSALAAAPIGVLGDRFGARVVVSGALAAGGLLFASLALLTSQLWHLYVVFAAIGIVTTGASPVGYARAVTSWFTRHRGLALAVAISGGSLGGVLHPAATHTLLRVVGWRTTCAILGSAIAAVGVPMALRFIRERDRGPSHLATPAAGVSACDGLRTRMFWILAVVIFCSSLTFSSTLVHLSALLSDRGLSAGQSAAAISVMGLASICGRLATGWLVDRFFAARVSLVLLVLAGSGAFLLSGANSFALGAFAAFLIGFGTSGETDVAPYLLSRYFGLRSFSTLYGLTWMSHATAAAVGPVLMGRAFDATGSYETVLVRLSIVAVSVAGLMLLMPRYDASPDKPVAVPV